MLWDEVEAPAAAGRHAGGRPRREHRSRVREARRLPGAILRELGHRASDTVLDRRIGSARELAFSAFPLGGAEARSAPRAPVT